MGTGPYRGTRSTLESYRHTLAMRCLLFGLWCDVGRIGDEEDDGMIVAITSIVSRRRHSL